MCLSFVAIPTGLLLYYGLEDDNADFFKNGDGVINNYEVVYKDVKYHLGVMVSDMAAIVCLSIVFGLISWLVHEEVLLVRNDKK